MSSESKFKTIFTLNCSQAARLLSVSQDASLAWWQRLGLRLHLLICASCRRYHYQLRWIRTFIRKFLFEKEDMASPDLRLSDQKRDRIQKNIDQIIDTQKDSEK